MAGVTLLDALKTASAVVLSTSRPMLAHVVVSRFCNLDCGYCNEFDKVSKPVPLEEMLQRIDHLARLKTLIVTLTGGEPLTHPDLCRIVERVREHGMIATVITNGFLLTVEWIEALNRAGLQEMQISIDGVKPDEISLKTLKSLRGKLQLLADHAHFHININSVLGISEQRTRDALEVAHVARGLGFSHTVGVLHDGEGVLADLSDTQKQVYAELMETGGSIAQRFNYLTYQKNLMDGRPNSWRCRAGARYLYICEFGLVHLCSQQRGYPGVPLADYRVEDIVREFSTAKGCAPFCTVNCVHQASFLDEWRGSQRQPPAPHAPAPQAALQ